MRAWITLSAVLLAMTSAAHAGGGADDRGERSLAKMLEGRAAGAARKCIRTQLAFNVEIVDKTAIVYWMPDGALYVNRPQAGAASLERQSVLETRSAHGETCRGDRVDVIESGGKGGMGRGSVLLGNFTPYAKPPR
ncbi:hypothetical protein [Caulobacter sp.]|uniref:hypothetical protein n=1 Tax=Caulobacter sp. TaxID=78 RepID=UPI002B4652C5|nr:hypothetical protein [Caulobacter sp.]HJV40307.1 hypothetical protein [Caulobacter sp.]